MESKSYKNELESFKSRGVLAIDNLLILGDQENFYIDYKNISISEKSMVLSESDRKNLAKAISGFSNTSGGLIVWGITDNGDNTFCKNPVKNPDNFVGLLNNAVSKLSLPILQEVNSFSIKNENGDGYVITEIPKYYFSPVQVNPSLKIKDIPGKYYVRSGSDFVVASHDIISSLYNRQRLSELIYWWSVSQGDSYFEDEEKIICRFGLVIQNKGNGVLRDIWINYTSGGINSTLEKTSQIGLFTGWNMFGFGLNLITDKHKLGPQQIINPFLIELSLSKKDLTEGAYMYISFGADYVFPHEINFEFTKEKMNTFLLFPKDERNASNFTRIFLESD